MPDEPRESLVELFRRFVGFGLRAWGGPAAQLAMIRQSAVEDWHWLTGERFNRLLGVYQVLPGPEATEMCVHLGYLRRGRIGGLLAGLGFALPGFLFMLALAILYVGALQGTNFLDRLGGFPAAVAALVAVACIRLGTHALHDDRLGLVFVWATAMSWLGTPFWLVLPLAGLIALTKHPTTTLTLLAMASIPAWMLQGVVAEPTAAAGHGGLLTLAASGLKAGLLTFGGAYTALPFLEQDAVGAYVTGQEFLDGVALSGILPAPFIIFATFLGYVGGGLAGAAVMTVGIFLPAFAFTLLGARWLERIANMPRLHRVLDGITAGVIGLLVATLAGIVVHLEGWQFALAFTTFFVLLRWTRKWVVPVAVLACGLLGYAWTA